jgi:hypothetical protein
VKFRWLGLFRAKAPPKATDAYRRAALAADDELVLVVPPVDDDVEAPPVMVRVGEPDLGPDHVPLSPMRKRMVVGIALVVVMMQLVIVFQPR